MRTIVDLAVSAVLASVVAVSFAIGTVVWLVAIPCAAIGMAFGAERGTE